MAGALLSDLTFHGTRFDERTRFPAGFTLPEEGLLWAGTGPDPRQAPAPAGLLGFEEFLNRLRGQAEPAALAKALAMLKAERFQLFARRQGS